MKFPIIQRQIAQHEPLPDLFVEGVLEWGKTAPINIFQENAEYDIYSKIKAELGPFTGDLHRKAVMLEVMLVLAAFESDGDWTEGVDTSRLGADTPENAEAGAWQVSFDSRGKAPGLVSLLTRSGIYDGITFQRKMKFVHSLACEYVARLMRNNTKHNGPLYKGDERLAIRKALRGEEHSIYPHLSRESVAEIQRRLAA